MSDRAFNDQNASSIAGSFWHSDGDKKILGCRLAETVCWYSDNDLSAYWGKFSPTLRPHLRRAPGRSSDDRSSWISQTRRRASDSSTAARMFLHSLTLYEASHRFESPSQHRAFSMSGETTVTFIGPGAMDGASPKPSGGGGERRRRVSGDGVESDVGESGATRRGVRHALRSHAFGRFACGRCHHACLPSVGRSGCRRRSWRQHLKLAVCGSTAPAVIPTQQGLRRMRSSASASRWSTLP